MTNDYRFMNEVLRIISGALNLDIAKVRNYTELLAEKLEKEGEEVLSRRLRELLEEPGRYIRPSDTDLPDEVLRKRARKADPKNLGGTWPDDEPAEELLAELD